MLAVIASACDGQAPEVPPPATATPAPGTPDVRPTDDGGGGDGERAGGILRVALSDDPSSLDPWYADDEVDLALVDALHDGLVRVELSGRVAPALAETWWFGAPSAPPLAAGDVGEDVAPDTGDDADVPVPGDPTTPRDPVRGPDGLLAREDARVLTFRLRDDARFHDGRLVTADHVVRGLRGLVARPDGGVAPYGYLLDDLRDPDGALPDDAVTALDERHVRLVAVRPAAGLLELLAHPAVAPRHPDAPDGEDAMPVGAGPFALAQAPVPDEFVRVRRHGGWGVGPADDGGPWLDEVIFRVYSGDASGQAQFADLLEGRVDVARVPATRRAQAEQALGRSDHPNRGPGLVVGATASTWSYGFDLAADPDAGGLDLAARTVVRAAIDADELAAGLLDGSRVALRGLLSPGVPGARADACGAACVLDPDVVVEARPVDPAAADEDAAGVGGADGPDDDVDAAAEGDAAEGDAVDGEDDERVVVPVPVPLLVTHDAGAPQDAVAAVVARQLREALGVDAASRAIPSDAYLRRLLEDPPTGPFRLAWTPDVPTAGAVLAPRFHSRHLGGNNLVRLDDPLVDDLLDRADRAPDLATRQALLLAAEDAVLATAAIAPVLADRHDLGVAGDVAGLVVDAVGRLDLSGARLVPAA